MKESAKLMRNLVAAAAALLAASVVGLAQTEPQVITSGTATINGSVSKAVQLTAAGPAVLTGNLGGGVSTNSELNGRLGLTVNLGDLSPNNTNPYVKLTIPLQIRSNAPYQLQAANAADLNLGGSGPGFDQRINSNDFGLGIANLAASGPLVEPAATTPGFFSTSAWGSINGDPTVTQNSIDENGRVRYQYAVRELNRNLKTIMGGNRVSNGGTVNSPDNALRFNLIVAVKPQYWAVRTVGFTLNLTVVSP